MIKTNNKVLLHICCGPCTVFPALKLKGLKVPFDCYFYNPNISNGRERFLRFENAVKLSKKFRFKLINYDDDFTDTKQNNNSLIRDCHNCYLTRLDEVFRYASQNKYQAVTTTLLGSPFQKHDLIITQMKELGDKYKVNYVLYNFKDGFYYGQKLAREMGLYCQKFCGCFASYQEFIQRELKKEQEIND